MTGKISGAAKGTMQESRLKHSVDVISQVYYLVIGFEVNGGQETFFVERKKYQGGKMYWKQRRAYMISIKVITDTHSFILQTTQAE